MVVDGARMLLSKPELSDVQRVRRMFEAFADKARLVQILNQCIQGGGVRVLIGEDSELTSELDFSVVATSYGVGERPLGTLGHPGAVADGLREDHPAGELPGRDPEPGPGGDVFPRRSPRQALESGRTAGKPMKSEVANG